MSTDQSADGTTLHATLDDFLAAAAELGLTRVVLRRIDEHRPAFDGGPMPTERLQRCELLAYHEGTLQKLVLDDTTAKDLAAPLAASGLEVTIRAGNIT